MSVKGRLEMIKMMIAAAALATTMLAAAAEGEYDFRRRLEVVHQADRRDPGAKRAANEFEFASGAVLLASTNRADYPMPPGSKYFIFAEGATNVSIRGKVPLRGFRPARGRCAF